MSILDEYRVFQDGALCFGSTVNVTCSFLEKPLHITSQQHHHRKMWCPILCHNDTKAFHILKMNLTGEDFLCKTLEYVCFQIKKGDELDESDVQIDPLCYYSVYILENTVLYCTVIIDLRYHVLYCVFAHTVCTHIVLCIS